MATTFREAPADVQAQAKAIIRAMYPDLIAADVQINWLFAHNGGYPALSHNGWPARALVKLNNLRDRVAGLRDCTIIIDADVWEDLSEEERAAIIDHELMHLDVKRNKVGAFLYDDCNRPKLRLKLHDFQMGGFHQIVKRHGIAATEAQAILQVHEAWVQNQFGIFQEA